MPDSAEEVQREWTQSESGHSNSSDEFVRLKCEVAKLVSGGAAGYVLSDNWVQSTAGIIMAQLAHVHNVGPLATLEADNARLREDLLRWQSGLDDAIAQRDAATKRADDLQQSLDNELHDWAETDTAIRDLCRPYLTETTCDHDGYAVVPITDAVRNAIQALVNRTGAAEQRAHDLSIERSLVCVALVESGCGNDTAPDGVKKLVAQRDAAEALVREVGEFDTFDYWEGGSQMQCKVCGASAEAAVDIVHTDSCLWLRCRRHGEGAT